MWDYLSLDFKCFSSADFPLLDSKNGSSSTGGSLFVFFLVPLPLYHLNTQLEFRMWCVENVVDLPVFTGAEVSPESSVEDAA